MSSTRLDNVTQQQRIDDDSEASIDSIIESIPKHLSDIIPIPYSSSFRRDVSVDDVPIRVGSYHTNQRASIDVRVPTRIADKLWSIHNDVKSDEALSIDAQRSEILDTVHISSLDAAHASIFSRKVEAAFIEAPSVLSNSDSDDLLLKNHIEQSNVRKSNNGHQSSIVDTRELDHHSPTYHLRHSIGQPPLSSDVPKSNQTKQNGTTPKQFSSTQLLDRDNTLDTEDHSNLRSAGLSQTPETISQSNDDVRGASRMAQTTSNIVERFPTIAKQPEQGHDVVMRSMKKTTCKDEESKNALLLTTIESIRQAMHSSYDEYDKNRDGLLSIHEFHAWAIDICSKAKTRLRADFNEWITIVGASIARHETGATPIMLRFDDIWNIFAEDKIFMKSVAQQPSSWPNYVESTFERLIKHPNESHFHSQMPDNVRHSWYQLRSRFAKIAIMYGDDEGNFSYDDFYRFVRHWTVLARQISEYAPEQLLNDSEVRIVWDKVFRNHIRDGRFISLTSFMLLFRDSRLFAPVDEVSLQLMTRIIMELSEPKEPLDKRESELDRVADSSDDEEDRYTPQYCCSIYRLN